MTRKEFIRSKRRWNWFIVFPAFVALFIMVLLPFVWIGFQGKHPDLSSLARIAGITVCICVFLFVVWFVYFYLRRVEERRFPHRCPSCKKGFAATEEMVLESGRCWYCGFQVIDESPNTALEPTATAP
jgi:DNA-directed RNA polymerase subunit RPC12/RpoP